MRENLLARPRRRCATSLLRWIGALAAAVLAVSCGREPTGADGSTAAARLNLGPLFETTSTQGSDQVTLIRVTVYLVNTAVPPGTTGRRKEIQSLSFGLDDARHVQETAGNVTINFEFPLQGGAAVYEVEGGAYNASGAKLFDVPAVQFTNAQVSGGGAVTVTSTAVYVGPGSQAVKIVIAPRSAQLRPGETQALSATAFDASGNAIAAAPLRWQTDNPQVAFFQDNRSGTVTGGSIGSTTVRVGIEGLPISDAIPVTVSLTPTGLIVVQGSGQTAAAGDPLPTPVRVRVVSGNVAVPGISVTFAASQGGSALPTQVTTNNAGEAETRWTLGPVTGTQTLTASGAGFQASVTANASPPPVRVTILSVSPPSLTVGQSATIIAEVRSTNLNLPVAGQQVNFASSGVAGSFNPPSATTNANGDATTVFTPTASGTANITATAGNSQASASIPVTQSLVVTRLVKVSGDNQTVQQGQLFGQPIVVEAQNAQGQPVAGVDVRFQNAAGGVVVTTNAEGLAAVLYQAPAGFTGTVSISVTLVSNPSISVTFTYTATP